jgi:hypothetical protein
MSELSQALSSLRVRIAASRGKRAINEENTKATLIVPVLRALGWDAEDLDSVVHEYKPRRADKPVDYALLVGGAPRLFIEAKALGENLDDRKWAGQIMGYASVAGVEWIVLTNGDEWRIYNAHAAVGVDEKLFRTVRISGEGTLAQETLALLAKEQWDGKCIELLWQAQFVDRKVRVAVEGMFGIEPDSGLVNAIRKRCPGLSPKDIRASMGRAQFTLEFPPVSPPPKGRTTKVDPPPPPPIPHAVVSPLDLINAGVAKAPLALERKYKGTVLKATLSAEGRILHANEAFDSFSAAGSRAMQTVLGSAKPPAINGWDFWRYQTEDGRSVPVEELREQYRKLRAKP